MPESVYIGRQEIYDRNREVVAYELLHRSDLNNAVMITEQNQATAELLNNVFTTVGLEELVGDMLAFVNMPRAFLVGEFPIPDLKSQIVVEILEHIEMDDEVMSGLLRLKEQGYVLALDDYGFEPHLTPFLSMVDIVKIDVNAVGLSELHNRVGELADFNGKLLAEKIETEEEAEACLGLGFELFQGYFFSRPKVFSGKRISGNQLSALELFKYLNGPDIESRMLVQLIGRDAGISYRLLRYVNSAMYGFKREIASIDEALMVLGLDAVRQLVRIVLAGNFNDGDARSLEHALLRAMMCERLACQFEDEANIGSYFLVGLFSALDVMLRVPREEVLAQLPLATDIKAAISDGRGEMGEALRAVLAYCSGDFNELDSGELVVDSRVLMDIYLDALPRAREWSRMV